MCLTRILRGTASCGDSIVEAALSLTEQPIPLKHSCRAAAQIHDFWINGSVSEIGAPPNCQAADVAVKRGKVVPRCITQ